MTSNKRTVRPICDGLWELADELSVMGMRFPLRMTIVALGEGELLLHSPVRIDDDAARAIAELGRVTDIVAPSMLHHVHAGAARERYPEAKLHASRHHRSVACVDRPRARQLLVMQVRELRTTGVVSRRGHVCEVVGNHLDPHLLGAHACRRDLKGTHLLPP